MGSAWQLGGPQRPGSVNTFCNAGINTWQFASSPAAFAYQVWVCDPNNPSTGQLVAYNYCYYPTTVAQLQGTCDTQYTNPPSQVQLLMVLFLSCIFNIYFYNIAFRFLSV